MKQAIIDLGTNTFHLYIAQKTTDGYETLFRESRPAKIGQAGINQGIITEAAIERALTVLTYFRQQLDAYDVAPEQVVVMGTSAIRVAKNQAEFIDQIRQATGLQIRVISGDQEAEYIYQGVRAAGALQDTDSANTTFLIVDIGGGSVEFIIGNAERIFWKQSFEIGGQRLLERFMPPAGVSQAGVAQIEVPQAGINDQPISPANLRRLYDYFQEQLLPLANAVHQYMPAVLVGSSGSFDTLVDMWFMHERNRWPDADKTTFVLPIEEFYRSYGLLLSRDHDERMQLPGMIELRVDMIVVAVCLIDYVLKTYGIRRIVTSTYSLKEGVLASLTD